MNKEELINELKKINISITKEQLYLIDEFYNLLIEWNKKINLTRITQKEDFYLKHVYDSLTINKVIDLNNINTLCDIGTGAGFPGIILKIIYPNLDITLIDSQNKKIIYLNDIIKKLKLKKIKAIHIRGEQHKEKYDIITSRAVANINKLTDYTMHLLNENGLLIALKGDIEKELDSKTKKEIEKKYIINKIEKFYLPKENSKRSIIILSNKSLKNNKL